MLKHKIPKQLDFLNVVDGISITVKTDSRLTKNGLKKTHFRTIASLTKKHRAVAYELASKAKFHAGLRQPYKQAYIRIRSYWCGKPMDYDGLACAVAPTIDGMVDAGIIEDDNPSIVKGYFMEYEQVKKRVEVRVEVSIEGVQ